jgi:protein SCO1/2
MRARLISFIVAGFLIGALAGAAILLVTTTAWVGSRLQSSGTALVGGPFSLVGRGRQDRDRPDFRGSYMLVFFGFTHCPDICPPSSRSLPRLSTSSATREEKVVPVFITLDPERDTPKPWRTM